MDHDHAFEYRRRVNRRYINADLQFHCIRLCFHNFDKLEKRDWLIDCYAAVRNTLAVDFLQGNQVGIPGYLPAMKLTSEANMRALTSQGGYCYVVKLGMCQGRRRLWR